MIEWFVKFISMQWLGPHFI